VHLFGFIIRIYHDARSPECQISVSLAVEVKTVHETEEEIRRDWKCSIKTDLEITKLVKYDRC